ncbi:hypothetical protein D3C83_268820 [compost metagenome]
MAKDKIRIHAKLGTRAGEGHVERAEGFLRDMHDRKDEPGTMLLAGTSRPVES